ncbi:MarR family winged helix-turn-helix transcriptional regulator [Actinacidiphila alni]|uniref:MarR family winged helix-turn-helix transcriptional regulator n=1 Tax=Actinacidiphila alni TaxID=380248 RepID=UPI001FE42826|nr:MarR family winged helix-turn-helix transcriptional regulator [Actinacidiphila alni]
MTAHDSTRDGTQDSPEEGAADGAREGSPAATAAERAWALMHGFVEAHNRHGDLADALGFRLGAGRGKVLFRLRQGPLTLRELAEFIGADAPYTTVVVDKLEAHGLVERRPHPDDRRRKLVALTAAGRRAVATADAILLRPPTALASVPERDLEQLTQLLARIVAADTPNTPDAP